ncbi:MAG: nitronate monooxygenase, partial [Planctomycetota bacterium]
MFARKASFHHRTSFLYACVSVKLKIDILNKWCFIRKIAPLRIGHLTIDPPIIQGGMGVRVSKANLAAAVANEGCAGVIATVGLGIYENFPGSEFTKVNRIA